MDARLSSILEALPGYRERLSELSEIMLANLVMIAETPAPTFEERSRVGFLLERFNEYHLRECSTDETGNALGIWPGTEGQGSIMVVAHLDTVFDRAQDHTVAIDPGWVSGVGLGDDSLGVAVVATLPLILEQLGISLRSDLILMGSARSLGRGDIEGLRFFLANTALPVSGGICVEGVKLGRLSYTSIGMLRGEIRCELPEEYDWTRFGAGGAIVNLNEVINRIQEIPLPRRPRTTIVFSGFDSGASFNNAPTKGSLRFEIRSESGEVVRQLGEHLESITMEVGSQTGARLELEVIARREPGGISFSHPFAAAARAIMKSLGIEPRITPSTSELSAFIDRGIPALTIGITDGENVNEANERLRIEPVATGLQQLVGLLLAMDGGSGDEH